MFMEECYIGSLRKASPIRCNLIGTKPEKEPWGSPHQTEEKTSVKASRQEHAWNVQEPCGWSGLKEEEKW